MDAKVSAMVATQLPPRFSISAASSASLRRSISAETSPWSPRSSISRLRQTAPPMKVSAAYSWFEQLSIQSRSRSPPGSPKAARCSAPYFTRTTSQPKASKIFSTRPNSPSRTIPSRDWRL